MFLCKDCIKQDFIVTGLHMNCECHICHAHTHCMFVEKQNERFYVEKPVIDNKITIELSALADYAYCSFCGEGTERTELIPAFKTIHSFNMGFAGAEDDPENPFPLIICNICFSKLKTEVNKF